MTSTGQANPISGSAGARVPNVAIIGMEGSGKTVLTTTLAKRLSTIDDRGVFLNPQGVRTLKYVERVWHTLQSGDWPPSTPPGELFELQWKLEIVGECACDLRLIDAAGQDLRFLFGDEQILSNDTLPGRFQTLAEYCRAADIIVFLINLEDFLGEANDEQRASNEAAIKSAMDCLARGSRPGRLGLLMTQWDQYRDMAEEHGGCRGLAEDAVPYVFNAHIKRSQIPVFPVSAVADTQVVVDPDGTARRVPVEGFHSEGIDDLVDWLKELVPEVQQELDQQAEARTMQQQLRGWITKQPYWRLILWVIVLASSIALVTVVLEIIGFYLDKE